MGSWGTGLYSNDTSSDVRDMCNEVYPLLGIEEGTRVILHEYRDLIDGVIDHDYANFWYALSDWQWKHGILTDEIRDKTIDLLEAKIGIEEWEEDGSAQDVKKRLAVMDKLLCQLKMPQPLVKIPKPHISKPKHKAGDIIIFRTCSKEYTYAESVWNIDACGFTDFYTEKVANILPKNVLPPYEAYEKYMAILCVGSVKEQYSQYAPGIMEEHSLYAYYDYIGDRKPTQGDLMNCGFLPLNIRYSADGNDPGKNAWTYTFMLATQSFTKRENASETIIEKIRSVEEYSRFRILIERKCYDSEYAFAFELFDVFGTIFGEKVRLSLIGIELDNLLDADKTNPALRTPKEIKDLIANEQKRWQARVDALEKSKAYQNANEEERVRMLVSLGDDA
ncbi:MAG: hypothetical protein E7616_01440 [Ruminococcaceae bacterium]|nr:hypothetical protein [Oscillospiraceae bacterium]